MKGNSRFFLIFACVLVTLPLLFTPFTFFPWQYGKVLAFQFLIEVGLLVFVTQALMKKKFQWKKMNVLDWSVVVFLLALVLTAFTGINFEQSVWLNEARGIGIFTWLHGGVLYFLLKNTLQTKKDWLRVFGWSVGVAFLVSLTAVFQNYLPQAWRGDLGGRFSGILGNPAFFASYILVHIGLCAVLWSEEQRKRRWVLAVLGAFFTVMIFYSGIRGAFYGLIGSVFVGFLVWLGLSLKKHEGTSRTRSGVLFGLLALIAFLVSGFLGYFQHIPFLNRFFDLGIAQGTGGTRLLAWKTAWHIFRERPIFGWGWGNFEAAFHKYFNPQFLRYSFQETVWDKPHNVVLEMMSAMGIFALTYLAIFGAAVWSLFFKKEKSQKKQNILFLVILLGYGVQNMFLFDTINVLCIIFPILAFISWHNQKETSAWSDVSGIDQGFAVAVILLLALCVRQNIQFLRVSMALQQAVSADSLFGFKEKVHKVFALGGPLRDENAILLADTFTKMEKNNMLGAQNVMYWKDPAQEITSVLVDYEKRYPESVSYPLWSAQVFLIRAQYESASYYDEAILRLQEAQKRSPQRQEVLFILARASLLKGDFASAIAANKKAVELAPNIGQSHFFLGLTYFASNNLSAAADSFEAALHNNFVPTREQSLTILSVLLNEKRYPTAEAQILAQLQNYPDDTELLPKLALTYALEGKKKEAVEIVDKIVVLYPQLKNEVDQFVQTYHLR